MRPDQRAWIATTVALLAGAAIYLLGRDWSTVYLLAWAADAQAEWPALQFGAWAGSAPSFAHAFGFALLTALVLGGGPARAAAACFFWGLTDAFLELLQRPDWSAVLPPLPPGIADWPLLSNVPAYFGQGQFDPLDLAAILLGACAAWLVARKLPASGHHGPLTWRASHATGSS